MPMLEYNCIQLYDELKGDGMSNLKMNSQNVKKSARDYALKPLKDAIIHGHLSPEHWVKRKSNGRLQASAISVAEASELFKVRARLEEMVTGEATLKAEKSDIEVLRSIAAMLRKQHIIYHRIQWWNRSIIQVFPHIPNANWLKGKCV